ncbi:MAG TPA: CocE/NonD family hydrolase [Acidimicrobiia bacterium]|nr:CocE/NonD family hydrolase [Acidimicrobiia bacterium]
MEYESDVRDGMRIDWDVPIEMDDGSVLRADVYRPDDDGNHPVLLSYGPYGKGLPFQEGYPTSWNRMATEHPDVTAGSTNKYQQWEVADPEKWVPEGYVCVRVDSRGAGRSPGYIDHFSPRETADLFGCIEWAGTRTWSNGKVGLAGVSYYAINQWHVASLQPPHLAAICPWEGAADFYRDMSHHGGIYTTFLANWYDKQVKTVQYGLGENGPVNPNTGVPVCGDETLSEEELAADRADLGADILNRPLDGSYYRERSPVWEKIQVPLLSAGNWGGHGLHLRGNVEGFLRAASEQKWLEIHGIEHWTEFYTDYGVNLQKRFFDHFLKGEDNGWDRQPPVHLRVRTLDGFVDRDEYEWPLERTRWTKLYLDSGSMALREEIPRSDSMAYEMLGDGVTFLAPPFESETEMTGPIDAKLFVESDTSDCDLFLVVRVFDPDGDEVTFQGAVDPHTPIAQGWLRASHRKLDPARSLQHRPYHTHDEKQPLEPGEIYELDVEVWPTCLVIPPGHRMALTVRGKDYEYPGEPAHLEQFKNPLRGCGPFLHDDPADRPLGTFGGNVRLHTGRDNPAYLQVPFLP